VPMTIFLWDPGSSSISAIVTTAVVSFNSELRTQNLELFI
jgi:hypothetical protein